MERRDFLKAGVVAGGSVGLGAVGCGAVLEGMSAVPVPSVAELQALDMDGYLRRLDTSLGFLQSSSSLGGILTKDVMATARREPRFARSEEVVRKTLRSMLLVGSFNDLPEPGRAHPGMQARLWNSMAEMDEAVLGMNTMMTSLAPTERADISRFLREDASAAPRILDTLDAEAEKAGVNEKRRAHLRDIGKHACFRLRQSTSLFIDEYDDKVQKVRERDASVEAFQRRLMVTMGEQAFWEYKARQTALFQAWQQVPGVAQAAPPLPASSSPYPTAAGTDNVGPAPLATGTTTVYPFLAPTSPQPYYVTDPNVDEEGRDLRKLRKGNILLGVGGGLFGLGLIAAGISAALVSKPDTQIGGYFVITAAALLGAGGIACLIAGGVIRSRA
jgi:hypothetical protein